MFVKINLPGLNCDQYAMIDTGADESCMSPDIFESLQTDLAPLYPSTIPLTTADGTPLQTRGSTVLSIGLGGHTWRCKFEVAENLICPVILGVDFLTQHSAVIECASRQITFTHPSGITSSVGMISYKPRRMISLVCAKTVTLKPNRAYCLAVRSEGAPVLAMVTETLHANGIYVPAGTINLSGESYIECANLSKKKVRLKAGRVIARAPPLPACHIGAIASLLDMKEDGEVESKDPQTLPTTEPPTTEEVEKAFDLKKSKDLWSNKQYAALIALLKKYHAIWNQDRCLSATRDAVHRIDVTDARPFVSSPYALGPDQLIECRKEVKKMLDLGVIRPSASPWASPIVMVPKPDGSIRFCIDYRRLNKITVRDAYPLPRIDTCLETAAGHIWYSAVDLRSGYWQIPMAHEDCPKTAFVTPDGQWEWSRMPFGLVNAPATFQRNTDNLLRGLRGICCIGYIDDLCIFTDGDVEEHLERLEELFERLRKANMQLKPNKCEVVRNSVKLLGHVVSKDGIKMLPKRIAAFQKLPAPTTKKQLLSAIGSLSYYAHFVPNFAHTAAPLNRLRRKDVPFQWSEECETAFQRLKDLVTKATVLAVPLPDKQLYLYTDACEFGIGAILGQIVDGQEKILWCASRALSRTESLYGQAEREALAVLYGLTKFRPFVSGVKVIVRTDAENIKWCLSQTKGVLARWGLKMMEFDIDFQHRKNVHHQNADGLSRSPVDPPRQEPDFESFNAGIVAGISKAAVADTPVIDASLRSIDASDLQEAYKDDPLASCYLPFEGQEPALNHAYQWFEGLLYEHKLTRHIQAPRLYVPASYRHGLMEAHHASIFGAHHGQLKTTNNILRYYTWPGATQDIKRYIEQCEECQRMNVGKEKRQGILRPYIVERRWQLVAMDFFGPLPLLRDRKKYILVLIDHLTKFVIAIPTAHSDAPTTVQEIHRMFCLFDFPEAILSDNGPHFIASIARQYYELFGIHKKFTSVYHPSANPLAEGWMKTLRKSIVTLCHRNPLSWAQMVPSIVAAYNSSIHPSTGCTPFFALFGREMSIPQNPKNVVDTPLQYLATTMRFIEQSLAKDMQKQATLAARKHLQSRKDLELTPGMLVFVRRRGKAKKMQFPWSSPCRVLEVSPNGSACRVSKLTEREDDGTPPKESWINVADVRIWRVASSVWKANDSPTPAAEPATTTAPSPSTPPHPPPAAAAAGTATTTAQQQTTTTAPEHDIARLKGAALRRKALNVRFPLLRRIRDRRHRDTKNSTSDRGVDVRPNPLPLHLRTPPNTREDVVNDNTSSHSSGSIVVDLDSSSHSSGSIVVDLDSGSPPPPSSSSSSNASCYVDVDSDSPR